VHWKARHDVSTPKNQDMSLSVKKNRFKAMLSRSWGPAQASQMYQKHYQAQMCSFRLDQSAVPPAVGNPETGKPFRTTVL